MRLATEEATASKYLESFTREELEGPGLSLNCKQKRLRAHSGDHTLENVLLVGRLV